MSNIILNTLLLNKDIETFFNHLCNKYIKEQTRRYINMDALRADFVRETTFVIADVKEAFRADQEKGISDDLDEMIGDRVCDIPFGFDVCDTVSSGTMEASNEIEEFVRKMAKST